MANSTRKGNAFELVVQKQMEALGFIVGSRRHVGGAGDLIGVHPDGRIWLTEVKACKNLYSGFTRSQRKEMQTLALPAHAELWLASKDRHLVKWTPASEWPSHED